VRILNVRSWTLCGWLIEDFCGIVDPTSLVYSPLIKLFLGL
jgi:hypothetical protein